MQFSIQKNPFSCLGSFPQRECMLGPFSWSTLEPCGRRNPISNYITCDHNLKKETVRGINPCLYESKTKKNEPDLTFQLRIREVWSFFSLSWKIAFCMLRSLFLEESTDTCYSPSFKQKWEADIYPVWVPETFWKPSAKVPELNFPESGDTLQPRSDVLEGIKKVTKL